jgi:hypothetical protein
LQNPFPVEKNLESEQLPGVNIMISIFGNLIAIYLIRYVCIRNHFSPSCVPMYILRIKRRKYFVLLVRVDEKHFYRKYFHQDIPN